MKGPSHHTILVGVTGGIGTGKSEVCKMFEAFGVPVLSADSISKELSVTDPDVRKKTIALLGKTSYLPDGGLNRVWVAEQIFSNPTLQRKLETILHPAVVQEIRLRAAKLEQQQPPLVVVEAALIYEAKLDKLLDAVIVVHADEPVRLVRAAQRDRTSVEQVRKRMKAQADQASKLSKADYIVYNNGTLAELKTRVTFLYSLLSQLGKA